MVLSLIRIMEERSRRKNREPPVEAGGLKGLLLHHVKISLLVKLERTVSRGDRCYGMFVDEDVAVNFHEHGKIVE